MANSDRVKARIPAKAKKGEIIEIKTQVTHDMESGQRKDKDGKTLPRRIISKFVVTFNNQPVMNADWYPGVAINPFTTFPMAVTESGTIKLAWHDEGGEVYEYSQDIAVE